MAGNPPPDRLPGRDPGNNGYHCDGVHYSLMFGGCLYAESLSQQRCSNPSLQLNMAASRERWPEKGQHPCGLAGHGGSLQHGLLISAGWQTDGRITEDTDVSDTDRRSAERRSALIGGSSISIWDFG